MRFPHLVNEKDEDLQMEEKECKEEETLKRSKTRSMPEGKRWLSMRLETLFVSVVVEEERLVGVAKKLVEIRKKQEEE